MLGINNTRTNQLTIITNMLFNQDQWDAFNGLYIAPIHLISYGNIEGFLCGANYVV